jgi:hypothetical protein
MSRQSDAKEAQGYQDKPEQKLCGGCQCLEIPMALPRWEQDRNAIAVSDGGKPRYTLERHGQPQTPRCGLGNFAVKKSATCDQFRAAVAPK